MMEILVFVLLVGALWGGFKVGTDGGRTQLLEAQSQSISAALSADNDFYRKTGLHGSYLLSGHEYRSPTGFVIVKFEDLERVLKRASDRDDGDQ